MQKHKMICDFNYLINNPQQFRSIYQQSKIQSPQQHQHFMHNIICFLTQVLHQNSSSLNIKYNCIQILKNAVATMEYSFITLIQIKIIPLLKSIAIKNHELIVRINLSKQMKSESLKNKYAQQILECVSKWAGIKPNFIYKNHPLQKIPSNYTQVYQDLLKLQIPVSNNKNQLIQKVTFINKQHFIKFYIKSFKQNRQIQNYNQVKQTLDQLCLFVNHDIITQILQQIQISILSSTNSTLDKMNALKYFNKLMSTADIIIINSGYQLYSILIKMILNNSNSMLLSTIEIRKQILNALIFCKECFQNIGIADKNKINLNQILKGYGQYQTVDKLKQRQELINLFNNNSQKIRNRNDQITKYQKDDVYISSIDDEEGLKMNSNINNINMKDSGDINKSMDNSLWDSKYTNLIPVSSCSSQIRSIDLPESSKNQQIQLFKIQNIIKQEQSQFKNSELPSNNKKLQVIQKFSLTSEKKNSQNINIEYISYDSPKVQEFNPELKQSEIKSTDMKVLSQLDFTKIKLKNINQERSLSFKQCFDSNKFLEKNIASKGIALTNLLDLSLSSKRKKIVANNSTSYLVDILKEKCRKYENQINSLNETIKYLEDQLQENRKILQKKDEIINQFKKKYQDKIQHQRNASVINSINIYQKPLYATVNRPLRFISKTTQSIKKNLLRKKILLLKNNQIEIGGIMNFSDNLLNVTLFVQSNHPATNLSFSLRNNIQKIHLKFISQSFFNKLQPDRQERLSIQIEPPNELNLPFQFPKIGVTYMMYNNKYEHLLTIPCSINRFLTYEQVSSESFSKHFQNEKDRIVMKNDVRLVDKTVLNNQLQFKELFPMMIQLNRLNYPNPYTRKEIKIYGTRVNFKTYSYLLKMTITSSLFLKIQCLVLGVFNNVSKDIALNIIDNFEKILSNEQIQKLDKKSHL